MIYSSSVRTSSWLRMRGRACSEKVFSLMIFRRSAAVRKIGRNKEMSRRISLLMSIRTNVGFHWIIRFWKIMESSWSVNEITSHYKDALFTEELIKTRHDFKARRYDINIWKSSNEQLTPRWRDKRIVQVNIIHSFFKTHEWDILKKMRRLFTGE